MTDPAPVALCAGSFDPITRGHESLVRRSLAFAGRVLVAVAHQPSQAKRGMFSVEERVQLIREVFADEPRVEADHFQGLLVDYARRRGVRLVVRGMRNGADAGYELQLAQMNRSLWPELDTLLLAPEPEHAFVSASLVREIASLGGDVSPYVSGPVLRRLRGRGVGREA